MKRFVLSTLALVLGVGLSACGSSTTDQGDSIPTDQILLDLPDVGIDVGVDTDKPDNGIDPGTEPDVEPDPGQPDGDTAGACEQAGGAYCPCVTSSDCMSNYCVNTAEGKLCTEYCVDSCHEGWTCSDVATGGADPVFICLPSYLNACKPCTKNADCYDFADNGDRCVAYGAMGSFCGAKCITDEHCPDGYACQEAPTVDGKTANQCLPVSGACECTPYFVSGGFTTECVRANGYGTCKGTRVCTEQGLSECDAATPEPEKCDLVDNDCDGKVDEELTDPSVSDCKHVGACEKGLEVVCQNGVWVCTYDAVPDFEAIEKSCDGIDNDCDGQTDEELTGVSQSTCLKVGLCTSGVQATCQAGVWKCNYTGVSGYEAVEATCNGKDDDCDGVTDEGLGGGACTNTSTYGQCPGTYVCKVDGTLFCDGPTPTLEICDGTDNNCDGTTDEGFPDSDTDIKADCVDPDDDNDGVLDDGDSSGSVGDNPCVAGLYAGCDDNCRLTFNPNQADLDGDGKGDVCDEDIDGDGDPNVTDCAPDNKTISKLAKELCFDEIDNDCDAKTDEAGGENCTLFYKDADQDGFGVLTDARCLCVAEVPYTASQVGDCTDTDAGVKPGIGETCNGLDDNCNGQADEGFPNTDGDLEADCVDADDDNDTILDDGTGDGTYGTPCAPGQTVYCDDNCRTTANGDQADQDGDGTGDLCETDKDGDGDPNTADCAPDDPTIFHGQVEPCDDVDNDCDGKTDEGEGGANCTTYYRDKDNDSYGVVGDWKCLCSPDFTAKYTTLAPSDGKWDCCDTSADTHPYQNQWYTEANACGGFDYDCSGAEKKEYEATGSCECGGIICTTCVQQTGWNGGAPACGAAGKWMDSCNWDWGCDALLVDRTQRCH
jgi:hypothetical protein